MRETINIGDSAKVRDTEQNRSACLQEYIGREGVVVSKLEYPDNTFVRLSWGFLDYVDIATWRIERTGGRR